MGNKRKDHPRARSNKERNAAMASLERAYPGASAAILRLAFTGLEYGREHERLKDVAASLRKFLAKVEGDQLFKRRFPGVPPRSPGQLRVDAYRPYLEELIGAVGKQVGALREMCDTLRDDLKRPAARESATLWGQPEIAMAAFAAFGAMTCNKASAPLVFKTAELMDIALALGVDSPSERRLVRKSRWESPSRKASIRKAVKSIEASLALSDDLGAVGLRALAIGTVPAGPFREHIVESEFGRSDEPLPPVGVDARVLVLDHDWTYHHILSRLPGASLPEPMRLIFEVPRYVHVTAATLEEWIRVLVEPPVSLSAFGVVSVEPGVQLKVIHLAKVAAKVGIATPIEPFGLVRDALRWDGKKIDHTPR